MAQGTRGRWMRVAATGLGVLLCTSLVGCLNTDKDKEKKDKLAKQPTPYLQGTTKLGPDGQPLTKSGQPTNQVGTGGVQQVGGVGPARVGSDGRNTNTGGYVQPIDYSPGRPGMPATPGAPAQPGFVPPSVLPPGAPGSYGSTNTTAPNYTLASASPGPDIILPPPPPGHSTAFGSDLAVQPPTTNHLGQIAPLPPTPALPAVSKGDGR